MEKDGFTLIELCFVTLVLGLFSTLAFSRLDTMLHYQNLAHINAQLLGFVRNVQRYAILSNTDTALCLREEIEDREWVLYSAPDNNCLLGSSIRQTRFTVSDHLQVRRYTSTEQRLVTQPDIVTFYASSGRSSANYRLVFQDLTLNQHVGIRITNIGALKLCASDKALVNDQGEEVLACQ